MPVDDTKPLTDDDIEVFREAVEGLYDGDGHPIELTPTDGVYVGFYPAADADELGVSYVYVADPVHHFDAPAPPLLSDAPQTLKTIGDTLRAVLCDITGHSYDFGKTDDEKGGVYYAAVLQRHPSATTQRES